MFLFVQLLPLSYCCAGNGVPAGLIPEPSRVPNERYSVSVTHPGPAAGWLWERQRGFQDERLPEGPRRKGLDGPIGYRASPAGRAALLAAPAAALHSLWRSPREIVTRVVPLV